MATPYQTVYDAFLAKVEDDDWAWVDGDCVALEDWNSILDSALPYFKFPRISLAEDSTGFIETLGKQEIQVIATLMKVEWLERTVASWENIKAFYAEADFSQANLLDKFIKLLEFTQKKADKLQHIYYRSVSGTVYPYGNLAGSE